MISIFSIPMYESYEEFEQENDDEIFIDEEEINMELNDNCPRCSNWGCNYCLCVSY